MPIYNIPLINRYFVADKTIICEFEKPKNFEFIAGQYGSFILSDHMSSSKNINRRFTLLPGTTEETFAILTRIDSKSEFKKTLSELALGEYIKFLGPIGDFTLHFDETNPAVFIAGGVGIAPFYSMLQNIRGIESDRQIYLFYGGSSVNHMPFLDVFTHLNQNEEKFHFIPVIENTDSTWEGEKGYITESLLRKFINDINYPIYYLCGSPLMVNTMREMLKAINILDHHIKVEDFPGY